MNHTLRLDSWLAPIVGVVLLAALSSGCGNSSKAAEPPSPPAVAGETVAQQDVPIRCPLPHSARPLLHPAAGKERLDADFLWADSPACRTSRVASDTVELTTHAGGTSTPAGVSPAEGGHGRQPSGLRDQRALPPREPADHLLRMGSMHLLARHVATRQFGMQVQRWVYITDPGSTQGGETSEGLRSSADVTAAGSGR